MTRRWRSWCAAALVVTATIVEAPGAARADLITPVGCSFQFPNSGGDFSSLTPRPVYCDSSPSYQPFDLTSSFVLSPIDSSYLTDDGGLILVTTRAVSSSDTNNARDVYRHLVTGAGFQRVLATGQTPGGPFPIIVNSLF